MRLFKILGPRYIVLIVVVSIILVHIFSTVTAEPGLDNDPVITQSYVDQKVNELNGKIESVTSKVYSANTTITELTKKINDLEIQLKGMQPDTMKFQPLQLKAGQKLTAGASVEIILRSGKAKAVAGTYGGLSDITAASSTDIKTGASIPLNHLLLVSRDDGRGLTAVTDIWMIIKGTYTVK